MKSVGAAELVGDGEAGACRSVILPLACFSSTRDASRLFGGRWRAEAFISLRVTCTRGAAFRRPTTGYDCSIVEPTPQSNRTHKTPSAPGRTHYRFFACDSLSTFLTIFCSSIRNARTMRSLTQLPHREPPYARCTDLVGRETCEYSWGRRAGIWLRQCAIFTPGSISRRDIRIRELDAAVTACCVLALRTDSGDAERTFRRGALLLDVQIAQAAAGRLDDAHVVGGGVVRLASSLLPSVSVQLAEWLVSGGLRVLTVCPAWRLWLFRRMVARAVSAHDQW